MANKYPTLNYEQFKEAHILREELRSANISQMTKQECRSHLHKIKRLLASLGANLLTRKKAEREKNRLQNTGNH